MGSRRPDTARTTLQLYMMKLLSELLNLSSWNSTTGSLELGKKDFHAKYTVKEQLKLNEEVKSLIASCLKVNTEERLSLAEVAAHPWLCITSPPKPSRQPLPSKKMLFSNKSVCHDSSSSSCSSSSSL